MGRHRPSAGFRDAVEPGVRIPRIEPLQKRIEGNRWRVTGFILFFTLTVAITLFSAFLAVFGAVTTIIVGAGGLTVSSADWRLIENAVAFGVLTSLITASLWVLARATSAEVDLTRRLRAQVAGPGVARETRGVLRDIALAAGLGRTPPLFIIDTPGVNAFALGSRASSLRIGVTQGMLDRIPLAEQRAVFANLVARAIAGDTTLATIVSVLMGPIWAMRDFDLRFEPAMGVYRDAETGVGKPAPRDWRASPLLLYGLAVIVTEVLAWYHKEAAWQTAEKADAEGMMLLKDPVIMLRSLENVLGRDNHVPTAGDAYSQLFYCWAGFGFAPEDDPEMRRVGRLRETLGAEGAARVARPNVPRWNDPPAVPPWGI